MEFNINSVWIIIGACMLMILVSVISQMRNDLKHMRITLDKIAERFGAIEIVTLRGMKSNGDLFGLRLISP